MNELKELKNNDFYSILLFILFRLTDNPEYSSLSRLAYILDIDNLLKLCKFFGGNIIKIPTIDQLEDICNGLLLYQKVDLEKQDFDKSIQSFNLDVKGRHKLISMYKIIKETVKDYDFNVQ